MLNDLEEENIYQAQKSKGEDQRKEKEGVKRVVEKEGVAVLSEVDKESKRIGGGGAGENDEEEKCICGKVIQESYWIQCSN